MIVHLNKIPVMWLTCSKTVVSRRDGMLQTLKKLQISSAQEINGPITNPHHLGVALSHLKALTRYAPPFLILEDDARLTPEDFKLDFSVPLDADALYLGTTTYGRWRQETVDKTIVTAERTIEYLQIYNMLTMHAILYLSKTYVDHVASLMSWCADDPEKVCDNLVADTMHQHRVFCLRKPMFFQDDVKNHCTLKPVEPAFLSL